jgi:uracil-DNA glycosylase
LATEQRRKEILRELGLTPLWRAREVIPQERPAASAHAYPVEPQPTAVRDGEEDADEARRSRILRLGWDELEASVASCTACPLCHGRTRTVFGVGDKNADWLYIGEGPGAQEDATGEPFVGQAGKLLDNMLAAIDLKRGRSVFIANIVKCRPPGNREPTHYEARQCEPYLARQIDLIKPRLIIVLGKVAAQNLLGTDAGIGSLRGKLHQHAGIPVIVTYHPAYLLRTPTAKAKAWEDLCFARSMMRKLIPLQYSD